MSKITFTDFEDQVRIIDAVVGDSVMETAVRNGVPGIIGECGGSLSCATCHVFVAADDFAGLPDMDEMEDEMLWGAAEDRQETSRLSCQLKVCEGVDLHVTTPETQV